MRALGPLRLLVPWPVVLALGVLLAGIEVAGVVSQWDVMRSWASVVEAVDGAWFVLGILVTGAVAAVTAYLWQHREVVAALPDSGARSVAAPGLVVGVVAVAVHALAVAVLLVWGFVVGLPGTPRLWPVLSVLAGLLACAMFGAAVARLGAGRLTPLLAMGLYVAVLYGARVVGLVDLIDLGGVSVVLVGWRLTPRSCSGGPRG